MIRHAIAFDTADELKAASIGDVTTAVLIGGTSISDGKAGLFRYDPASVAAEDTKYLNVIKPNSGVGRWLRTLVRNADAGPGGAWPVDLNGQNKTIFAADVTNATGKVTFNVTQDGTAAGAKLLTEVRSAVPEFLSPSTAMFEIYEARLEGVSADGLTSFTFGVYRQNAISGLGLYALTPAGAGIKLRVAFKGV